MVPSDIHAGCRFGLCVSPVKLDGGGTYKPSRLQGKVADWWTYCWHEWLPSVTKGAPFAVAFNGDALEGDHHRSKHAFSTNVNDQQQAAVDALAPIVELCGGRYYHILGTEAHVGPSGEHEQALARRLGAIPDSEGVHARWALWARLRGVLIHVTHHIGTTTSAAYESTAPHKELIASFEASVKSGRPAPQCIVRGHRHRFISTQIGTSRGPAIAVVTPGWQLPTPYVYRTGHRITDTELGLVVIKVSDTRGKKMTETGEPPIQVIHRTFYVERPNEVHI